MPGLFKPLSAFVSSSGSKIKPAFKLRIYDIVYVLKFIFYCAIIACLGTIFCSLRCTGRGYNIFRLKFGLVKFIVGGFLMETADSCLLSKIGINKLGQPAAGSSTMLTSAYQSSHLNLGK